MDISHSGGGLDWIGVIVIRSDGVVKDCTVLVCLIYTSVRRYVPIE